MITITDASNGKIAIFDDPGMASTCAAGEAGVKTIPYTPSTETPLIRR
jgi:hypothetical protein